MRSFQSDWNGPDALHSPREIRTPRRSDGPRSSSPSIRALARLVERHGPEALLAEPLPEKRARDLRRVVRLLCAEGRREDPRRAEHLVKSLRAQWSTLPAVRRVPRHGSADRLLEVIIARCIAEFYVPNGSAERTTAD